MKISLFVCFVPYSKLSGFNIKELPSGTCSGSLHIYEGDEDHVFTVTEESIGGMGM